MLPTKRVIAGLAFSLVAMPAMAADLAPGYRETETVYDRGTILRPGCYEYPHFSELHCRPEIVVPPRAMSHDDLTALTTVGPSRKPYYELSTRRIY